MEADKSEIVVEPVDEVVVAEDDEVVQVPQVHSEPRPPSARERARQNLMHFPYRRWCRHCVWRGDSTTLHTGGVPLNPDPFL